MFASADPLAFLDFASLSLMLEIRIAATPPEFQPIPELSTLRDLVSVLIYTLSSITKVFIWFCSFIPADS